METARSIVLMAELSILSIEDIRRREIPRLWIMFLAGVGMAFWFFCGERITVTWLLRFVPGVMGLFLAWITGEQLGYGDVFVVLALGMYMDAVVLSNLCMFAMILAGIVSLGVLAIGRKSRKYEIPFIPFLLAGYVLVRWWE